VTIRDLVAHRHARTFAIMTAVALYIWWTHRAAVPLWRALVATYLSFAITGAIWWAAGRAASGIRWVAGVYIEMVRAELRRRRGLAEKR
jgi:hypothetical protein